MGLFDSIGKGLKKIGKVLKDVGETVVDVVVTTAYVVTHPVEVIEKAAEFIGEYIRLKEDSTPTIGKYRDSSSNTYNADEEKRRIEEENKMIGDYQSKVVERATTRENTIKEIFKKIYYPCITEFEKVLDDDLVNKIKIHIQETAETFSNKVRDEVNAKVNSSNYEWSQLTSNHPTQEKLQNFCDRVYKDANKNFLELVQEKTKETNSFISGSVQKYYDDMQKALDDMRKSLVSLTSDEETKSQELMKCAKKIAVAQYIVYETSKNI